MKNALIKTVGTISVVAALIAPGCAVAKSKPLAVGSVTNETLGAPPAAILPSNPFYGMTKAFSKVKSSLLVDKFSRLSAQENLLNRRGAELLRTYAVAPKNEKATLAALSEYQNQLYQYTLMLNRLATSESVLAGENEEYGVRIAMTGARHTRFIDDIAGWPYMANAHLAILTDLDDRLGSSAVTAISNLIGTDSFVSLATSGLNDQSIVEQIRGAEVLSIISKHAARKGANEIAQVLLEARRDILIFVAQSATSEDIAQIGSMAGSRTERLQTILLLLDMPELRDNQQLIDAKNQLLIQVF